jgi:hypothetical protein
MFVCLHTRSLLQACPNFTSENAHQHLRCVIMSILYTYMHTYLHTSRRPKHKIPPPGVPKLHVEKCTPASSLYDDDGCPVAKLTIPANVNGPESNIGTSGYAASLGSSNGSKRSLTSECVYNNVCACMVEVCMCVFKRSLTSECVYNNLCACMVEVCMCVCKRSLTNECPSTIICVYVCFCVCSILIP